MRAYVNPSRRSVLDKLPLTRDLPKAPGTYRFVDKDGQILYVGKADRLRERVRSHFVGQRRRHRARSARPCGWSSASTGTRRARPLEAVVREQELILEHRPSCNMHGTTTGDVRLRQGRRHRPGPQSLTASSRAPKWLTGERPAALATPDRRHRTFPRPRQAEHGLGPLVIAAIPFAVARAT